MDKRGRVFSLPKTVVKPTKLWKRNYTLQVAFNDIELKDLHKKAESNHMRLATYVRMAAMKYKAKWRAEA